MIRALKCFVQVILVMAITSCTTKLVQSNAISNLKLAEDRVHQVSQSKLEREHAVAKPYIDRANKFIKVANKARRYNNNRLANQYALLAVSETQVAMAALQATAAKNPYVTTD